MFQDWSQKKSEFKAGNPRALESDSYSANAVYRQGEGVRCGGGIEKGNPSWSRATTFHPCSPRKRASQADKAPDVLMVRTFSPVRSLNSLVERTQAPTAKESPSCMTGKAVTKFDEFSHAVKRHAEIHAATERASVTYKALALLVEQAPMAKGERQEVAFRKTAKAKESKLRLAAKAKAITDARKTQDAAKLAANRKAARMDWRRNFSRIISASVWL